MPIHLQEEQVDDSLPQRPGLLACSPGVELLGSLEALPSADEVDLVSLLWSLSFPSVANDVKGNNDREGEVGKEESLGSCGSSLVSANRPDGNVLKERITASVKGPLPRGGFGNNVRIER